MKYEVTYELAGEYRSAYVVISGAPSEVEGAALAGIAYCPPGARLVSVFVAE